MSTRCQVKIVDADGEVLWFYRHSDGYPDCALLTLKKFMQWVADGEIRNNIEQAAGWLIVIGNEEYSKYGSGYPCPKNDKEHKWTSWKVGAYEPCVPKFHGDIEFFYILELDKLTITVQSVEHYVEEPTGKFHRRLGEPFFKTEQVVEIKPQEKATGGDGAKWDAPGFTPPDSP